MNTNEINEYLMMINALSINYLNVFIVDPNKNFAKTVKLDGYVTEGIKDVSSGFNYQNMLAVYAKGRVYDEDLNDFLEKLSPESLIDIFSDNRAQVEIPYRVIDNHAIHYYVAHYIRVSKDGEALKLVVGFRNVDKTIIEEAKHHEEGLNKAYHALANVYYAMYRIDLINNTFYSIKSLGYVQDNLIKGSNQYEANVVKVMHAIVTPPFVDEVLKFVDYNTMSKRLRTKKSISMEFIGIYSGWVRISLVVEDTTSDNLPYHVLFIAETIEDEKREQDALRILAEKDQLTGIYNRGTGEKKIKELIDNKECGLFCLMDCDNFKAINDNFGHEVGDLVLKQIAKSLNKEARDTDIVMRLGGDEFLIYVTGVTSVKDAKEIWDKIVSNFNDIKIDVLKNNKISISAGCVLFDGKTKTNFNEIYKTADNLMYRSKKQIGSVASF